MQFIYMEPTLFLNANLNTSDSQPVENVTKVLSLK